MSWSPQPQVSEGARVRGVAKRLAERAETPRRSGVHSIPLVISNFTAAHPVEVAEARLASLPRAVVRRAPSSRPERSEMETISRLQQDFLGPSPREAVTALRRTFPARVESGEQPTHSTAVSPPETARFSSEAKRKVVRGEAIRGAPVGGVALHRRLLWPRTLGAHLSKRLLKQRGATVAEARGLRQATVALRQPRPLQTRPEVGWQRLGQPSEEVTAATES